MGEVHFLRIIHHYSSPLWAEEGIGCGKCSLGILNVERVFLSLGNVNEEVDIRELGDVRG